MRKEDFAALTVPDAPGVYLFRDARRRILYVGKATSLKDRVRSYFNPDVVKTRGGRIVRMVLDAATVTWEECDSVLEALILEAQLIKKNQPPANVREKDNKSFNYVVVTDETFPRVLLVRGRELLASAQHGAARHHFGPFPHGGELKEALRLVRKIFPYRDTCVPGQEKPCFNRQIGLCPGVCDGTCSQKEYARTIRHIATLFSGKKKTLLASLGREMKAYARRQDFEAAARARAQVKALTHVRDVALMKRERLSSTGDGSVGFRIECYDIAHTSGAHPVGVMTVIDEGESVKRDYRTFNVRGSTNDDIASLSEVLKRRFAHTEWPMPRLVVVDGGEVHRAHAEGVLRRLGIAAPVLSVVKDDRHKAKQILGDRAFVEAHREAILLGNAEAHRFAVGFHRKQRGRRMLRGS